MMNRFTFCCWIFFFLFVNLPNAVCQVKGVSGQFFNTRQISGSVRDTTGEGRIPYAHVSFICGKDTTRIVADTYGDFVYKGIIEDTMQICVSAMGYKPFVGNFHLQEHGFKIKVLMQQDVVALNEVIIQGNHVAMVILFNALGGNLQIIEKSL
jgi:hypothetical protein